MIHNIQTVSNYIEEIEKLINNKHHNYYFRGQDDAFCNTLPAIFRSRKLLDNEDNLFNDFLMTDPQLFEKCRTNFERLALMEHYHLPTRLLDVSSNPLIALFFAVKGGQGNGEVYVYKDEPNPDKLAEMLEQRGWQNLIAEYKSKNKLTSHNYFKKNAFSNEMQLESSLARQSLADKAAFSNQLRISTNWIMITLDSSTNYGAIVMTVTLMIKILITLRNSSVICKLYHSCDCLKKPSGIFQALPTS